MPGDGISAHRWETLLVAELLHRSTAGGGVREGLLCRRYVSVRLPASSCCGVSPSMLVAVMRRLLTASPRADLRAGGGFMRPSIAHRDTIGLML